MESTCLTATPRNNGRPAPPRSSAARQRPIREVTVQPRMTIIPMFTPKQFAAFFLAALDSTRFEVIQSAMRLGNDDFADGMPDDIDAAYRIVEHFEAQLPKAKPASQQKGRALSTQEKKEAKSTGEEEKKPAENGGKKAMEECRLCKKNGKPGQMHWYRNCPIKIANDKAAAAKTAGGTGAKVILRCGNRESSERRNFLDFVLRLDNCSDCNVIRNRALLEDVRTLQHPFELQGVVEGPSIVVKECGILNGIGVVYYCPDATANILSYYRLVNDGFRIESSGYGTRLYGNGHIFEFSGQHDFTCKGTYPRQLLPLSETANMDDNPTDESPGCYPTMTKAESNDNMPPSSNEPEEILDSDEENDMESALLTRPPTQCPEPAAAYIASVKANLAKYSKNQVKRAKRALDLTVAYGYASIQALSQALNNGFISGLEVSSKDLRVAIDIWGDDPAYLRGKTTRQVTTELDTPSPSDNIDTFKITLCCDIFFVEEDAFFVSVGSPIGYRQVTYIKGKSYQHVKKALGYHVSRYKAYHHEVVEVVCDSDAALIACELDLAALGINIMTSAAGQHQHTVESNIRRIKETTRAGLHGLPYYCPTFLVKYLVDWATSRLNLHPRLKQEVKTPPFELMFGLKVNYRRDLTNHFGAYCSVPIPGDKMNNTMTPRANECLALCPTINKRGAWKFWNIASGSIMTSERWTILPITQSVINMVNSMKHNKSLYESVIDLDPNGAECDDGDSLPEPTVAGNAGQLGQGEHTGSQGTPPNSLTKEGLSQIMDDASDLSEDEDSNDPLGWDTDVEESPTSPENIPLARATLTPNEDVKPDTTLDEESSVSTKSSSSTFKPKKSSPKKKRNVVKSDYKLRDRRQIRTACHTTVVNKSGNMTIAQAVMIDENKALAGVDTELGNMERLKVFEPIDPSTITPEMQKKIIPSRMFLKEKLKLAIFKARLVAGGHKQLRDLLFDYSSPTVNVVGLYALLALAAHEHYKISCHDVTAAYLNAFMPKHILVFMRLSKEVSERLVKLYPEKYGKFVGKDGCIVVKLLRALYGCIESAKLWYDEASSRLVQAGYRRSVWDECIFVKGDTIIALYVDDFLVLSKTEEGLDATNAELKKLFPEISCRKGDTQTYLGIDIQIDRNDRSVTISMNKFVEDMLKFAKIDKGGPPTPTAMNVFEISPDKKLLDQDEAKMFHTLVAKMLYLAKRTRPDLLTAVAFLTTSVQSPTVEDRSKLNRALGYIHGTKDLKLTLKVGSDPKLRGSIDASYAVHTQARKSHSGCAVFIGNALVYAGSKKQKTITHSSTESEICAVSDSLDILMWLKNMLEDIGFVFPTVFEQDNTSAILDFQSLKPNLNLRKYIDLRRIWVARKVREKVISVVHVPTTEMVSDMLTKPLSAEIFCNYRSRLGLL